MSNVTLTFCKESIYPGKFLIQNIPRSLKAIRNPLDNSMTKVDMTIKHFIYYLQKLIPVNEFDRGYIYMCRKKN